MRILVNSMTYKECLREGARRLGIVDTRDRETDAWILLEYVTGMNRIQYLMRMNDVISEDQVLSYEEVIKEREGRKPVQHITGWQEFMGLPFHVNEHVLIPRQDTELLVEETIALLKDGMEFLDLCTGSGCILTSVLILCGKSGVQGTGSDISPLALEVAKKNLQENEVEAELIESDLFENIDKKFDLIVSNPPYIATGVIEELEEEVRDHDPMLALDGKEDGLYFYRKIIKEAKERLKSGGYLLFEIGYDQGQSVPELLKGAGYTKIQVKKDLAGLDRVVIAMYNNSQ